MSKSPKTERMQIRLSPDTRQLIIENAKRLNVSQSAYIEFCITRKKVFACNQLPDLIYHLSKIGTNINQIATVANTNKNISPQALEESQALLRNCYEEISKFVSHITETDSETSGNKEELILELLRKILEEVRSK